MNSQIITKYIIFYLVLIIVSVVIATNVYWIDTSILSISKFTYIKAFCYGSCWLATLSISLMFTRIFF